MDYPPGLAADYWNPFPSEPTHRFALGRRGSKPLVALAMNPSHADESRSDRTINRLAEASVTLKYDGWLMLNLYPERSPSPRGLGPFDRSLSDANCVAIIDELSANGVSNVLGAWGNPPHPTIRMAKVEVLKALKGAGIGVFYFGTKTLLGNPRHPNPRARPWDISGPAVDLPL
ncbi:MAG: DUF1643 domain-containing protein [Microbacteriaceae bacterium]